MNAEFWNGGEQKQVHIKAGFLLIFTGLNAGVASLIFPHLPQSLQMRFNEDDDDLTNSQLLKGTFLVEVLFSGTVV